MTYALFKRVIKYEPCLTNIKVRKHQVMMSEFRLSSHDLEIESGRYGRKPTKPAEPPCIMCVQYRGGCSVPWGIS